MAIADTAGYRWFLSLFTIAIIVIGILNITQYRSILNDPNDNATGVSRNKAVFFMWLNIILVIICFIFLFYSWYKWFFGKSPVQQLSEIYLKTYIESIESGASSTAADNAATMVVANEASNVGVDAKNANIAAQKGAVAVGAVHSATIKGPEPKSSIGKPTVDCTKPENKNICSNLKLD